MCFFSVACILAVAAPVLCHAQVVSFPTPDDKIIVGILDDAREEIWHGNAGPIKHRVVMPAFEKDDSGWRIVTAFFLHKMKWTIAFDGKNLGEVETEAQSRQGDSNQGGPPYSREKLAILTSIAGIPTIGQPSEKFTGVTGILGPLKVRRPLMVVSKPYFKDPDGWKRVQLQDEIVRLVRQGFRKQYPHVDRCKNEEIAEHDWKFPDSALMFDATYASNKHAFLVGLRLNAGDCGWGGQPDDPLDPWVDQWFVVAADRSVRRIGGYEQLVDAGDYDNDGISEFVFFSTRSERTDAYDLVYDNFQKRVDVEISYR